jgi:hypothetical protein
MDKAKAVPLGKSRASKVSVVGMSSYLTATFIRSLVGEPRRMSNLPMSSEIVGIKSGHIRQGDTDILVSFMEFDSGPFFAPMRWEMYNESAVVVMVIDNSFQGALQFESWSADIDKADQFTGKKVLVVYDADMRDPATESLLKKGAMTKKYLIVNASMRNEVILDQMRVKMAGVF